MFGFCTSGGIACSVWMHIHSTANRKLDEYPTGTLRTTYMTISIYLLVLVIKCFAFISSYYVLNIIFGDLRTRTVEPRAYGIHHCLTGASSSPNVPSSERTGTQYAISQLGT
jgi:hypothetical protein